MYLNDLKTYNDINGPTQSYLDAYPEERYRRNSLNSQDVFDNYEDAPTLEGTEGITQSVLNALGTTVGDLFSDYARLLKYGGNKWGKDWVQQKIDTNAANIYDQEVD